MANDHPMQLRVSEAFLQRLDRWRQQQSNPPTRPEAVRQIVDAHLAHDTTRAAPLKRKGRRA